MVTFSTKDQGTLIRWRRNGTMTVSCSRARHSIPPTDGDFVEISYSPHHPQRCLAG